MFVRLEEKHLPIMVAYIEQFKEAVIYLLKPMEQFESDNSQGFFYGYLENEDQLQAIFYFSNKRVMALHTTNEKILRNLQLLKTIKDHKPKFIKGLPPMIEGIYKLICRSVVATTESKSTLMIYDEGLLPVAAIAPYECITGKHEIVDELLSDLRFFIDVETHFGKPVKAINDIVKTFKSLIGQENYLLIVSGKEIVAQGLIEDETADIGILAGIYVAPKHRNIGLGALISSALTNELISRDKKPYLFVMNTNRNAQRLYEKIGYKAVEQYAMLTVTY